jgi:HK97 family phage prohead protease
MEDKIKDFRIKDCIKAVDQDEGIVQIYVSSFGNKDSDGDIIERGAFSKTIKENISRIKHLKDHDRRQLLGLPVDISEDEKGLLVTSKMNLEKPLVKDVFSDYKFFADNGRSLEHSIGFNIIKGDMDQSRNAFIIKEIKLAEYSTLSFLGANENTPLVDIKALKNKDIILDQLTEMIKGDYSDQRLESINNLISKLKSLLNEPDKPLELNEPTEEIKELNELLKIIKNGR